MLTPLTSRGLPRTHSKQKGVVLLITLIMLVAMTLAAIALMRSVDTTNLVAGNLSFQQASVDAADIGTEQAIAYLYNTVTSANTTCDGTNPATPCPNGYKSFHQPFWNPLQRIKPWETFWNSIISVTGVQALTNPPPGYSGAYVIEAMCTAPRQVNCALASSTTSSTVPQGQDMGSTTQSFQNQVVTSTVHYYRITTRVVGPRNSVGYVQAMIAW